MTDREERYLERVDFHLQQIKAHANMLNIEWLNEPEGLELNDFLQDAYPFPESFDELVPKINKWVDEARDRLLNSVI